MMGSHTNFKTFAPHKCTYRHTLTDWSFASTTFPLHFLLHPKKPKLQLKL